MSELDEEQVDGDSADDDGEADADNLRLLEHWHEDKEATDEEEQDGEDDVDPDGSFQVRLLPSEIENSRD